MSTSQHLPRVDLGSPTGRLTPGPARSLRSAGLGLVLLAPAALVVRAESRPTLLVVAVAAVALLGLLVLLAAVVELLPTPGRLTFHEHGFVDTRADGAVHVYADGYPAILRPAPSSAGSEAPSATRRGDGAGLAPAAPVASH